MVSWRRKRHLETVEVLEFFVGSCAGGGGAERLTGTKC